MAASTLILAGLASLATACTSLASGDDGAGYGGGSAACGSLGYGHACTMDYECGLSRCNTITNECRASCSSDVDCQAGATCHRGACVRPGTCGTCAYDSECGAYKCDSFDHTCETSCSTKYDCQYGNVCTGMRCERPGQDGLCDYSGDCAMGASCNLASNRCTCDEDTPCRHGICQYGQCYPVGAGGYDEPNAELIPEGEGWHCVYIPDLDISTCARTRKECMRGRRELGRQNRELSIGECERLSSAACLTAVDDNTGQEDFACAALPEHCARLRDLAAEPGATLSSVSVCRVFD